MRSQATNSRSLSSAVVSHAHLSEKGHQALLGHGRSLCDHFCGHFPVRPRLVHPFVAVRATRRHGGTVALEGCDVIMCYRRKKLERGMVLYLCKSDSGLFVRLAPSAATIVMSVRRHASGLDGTNLVEAAVGAGVESRLRPACSQRT